LSDYRKEKQKDYFSERLSMAFWGNEFAPVAGNSGFK